jgi:hypothetical protein
LLLIFVTIAPEIFSVVFVESKRLEFIRLSRAPRSKNA